jgi:chromosome segregation ATPase
MARKLTDDRLRIILDVEAKGVQATLQQIAAETFRLADANKEMKSEMKDAEKQMKDAEKTMQQLEKAGKTNTVAYLEAKNTFEAAKAEVEDYRRKIEDNTKSIADNEKLTKEIIKTMDIQEMTMSQLKRRAYELQKQLNNTSASLSPEAYNRLQQELSEVNERMAVVQNTGKSMLDQFASMDNPAGRVAGAVKGFGQALKMLIANSVGIVLMAIVAAFML